MWYEFWSTISVKLMTVSGLACFPAAEVLRHTLPGSILHRVWLEWKGKFQLFHSCGSELTVVQGSVHIWLRFCSLSGISSYKPDFCGSSAFSSVSDCLRWTRVCNWSGISSHSDSFGFSEIGFKPEPESATGSYGSDPAADFYGSDFLSVLTSV